MKFFSEEKSVSKAAFFYAEAGYKVFPASYIQKDDGTKGTFSPLCKHGYKSASKDADQIYKWWASFPGALISIPTGIESGLLALVVKSNSTFSAKTVCFSTPFNEVVYLFQSPKNKNCPIFGQIEEGTFHGEGSSIIVPPSSFSDKTAENKEVFGAWKVIQNGELAEIPAPLLEKMCAVSCVEKVEQQLAPAAAVPVVAKTVVAKTVAAKEKSVDKTQKYKMFDGEIWKVKYNEVEEKFDKLEKLSSYIEVLALTRTEDKCGWGAWLKWYDPDGETHTWPMPFSMLNQPGSPWLMHLQEEGFCVSQEGVNYLRGYLANAGIYTQKRARLATKTGWSEDNQTFALPHRNLGADQEEQVVMQQNPNTAKMYRSAGTLEEWKREVAAKSVGNSRLTFMLCAALTGPMLYLVGGESGGFHIVGESSKGKSTALRLAASVWGDQGGHFKSWRTTDNAAESLAVFSNDTCLVLDEIGQAPAKACAEMAYMLANGNGKSRAGRDGQAKMAQSWRLCFLSSGEITLAQKMSEIEKGNVKAGQEVRMAEIMADAGRGKGVFETCHGMPPAEFAMKIKEVTNTFYGTAGPAFVEILIKEKEISKKIRALSENFAKEVCEETADGQVIRVAQRFGMCLAAGQIAVEHGIFPHTTENIEESVKKCFESWLEMRGGQGAGEDKEIIKTIKLFIGTYGQSHFQNLNPRTDSDGNEIEQICLKRFGYRSNDEYYVLEDAWQEIFKKFHAKKVVKVLIKEGIIDCQEQEGRSKTKKSFPGVGKVRCYVVRINDDKTSKAKKEIEEKEAITSKIFEQGELMDDIPTPEFCAEIINGMAV